MKKSDFSTGAKTTPISQIFLGNQARNIAGSAWLSALSPVQPIAPAGTPVRQYDIQPGANLNWQPGEQDGNGQFQILRQVADNWDMLRLVIETVKDRICNTPWEIRLKHTDPSEQKRSLKERNSEDPRVTALNTFFQCPDGFHSWAQWLRMSLEDMIVLDAATLYFQRDIQGKIAAIRPIDGATINRVITDQGFTPLPPATAYQQVLQGMPAINLTANDILYPMHNPRTGKRYGYGAVEQMLITISIGLRRQRFQLAYYTEGNMPEGLCFMPPSVPIDKVKEVQDWFDTMMAGDVGRRRRLQFLPGLGDGKASPNVIFPKEVLLKDEMDEWLFKIICYNLGVSPQNMVKQMNRASAQQSQENSEEEGLEPKLNWITGWINQIIQLYMGYDDIEFSYKTRQETDALKQAQIDDIYVQNGTITREEVRENLGRDKTNIPNMARPGVISPSGFIGVDQDAPDPATLMSGAGITGEEEQDTPPDPKAKPGKIAKSKRIIADPAYTNPALLGARSRFAANLGKIFGKQRDKAAHKAAELLGLSKSDSPEED